jgi:hypothetical protein
MRLVRLLALDAISHLKRIPFRYRIRYAYKPDTRLVVNHLMKNRDSHREDTETLYHEGGGDLRIFMNTKKYIADELKRWNDTDNKYLIVKILSVIRGVVLKLGLDRDWSTIDLIANHLDSQLRDKIKVLVDFIKHDVEDDAIDLEIKEVMEN